jgi:hypothetical protein
MKKNILFLGLMLSSTFGFSYQPLIGNSEQTWLVDIYGLILLHTIETLGPTEVHGNYTYTSIMQAPASDPSQSYQVGLIREDIENQKIYMYVNDQEYLLYDFDVQINDVIQVFSVGQLSPITITNIETVEINGISREKISFSDDWYNGYYIEGIGSDRGIRDYNTAGIADYSPQLTCYYENNALVFDNPNDASTCGLTLSVDEKELLSSFAIFPNPSSDVLFIATDGLLSGQVFSLQIIDMIGNVALAQQFMAFNKNQIDLSNLSAGSYIIRLSDKNGSSANKIFTKGE